MDESNSIIVNSLTKKYSKQYAIKDLRMEIRPGHIYGFLGPNGAGKSTTMNIITGCLGATAGTVSVCGYDIFRNAKKAKKCIGYLPEIPPLYPDMKVKEYLEFVAEEKRICRRDRRDQVYDVMAETQILNVSNRLIKNLSKGYKQRVGIAQALLGNPEFIILDEPTVGLDPVQLRAIRELIISLKDNHTVFISSHIMQEIEAMCDYLFIIAKGEIIEKGLPETIMSRYSDGAGYEVHLTGEPEKVLSLVDNGFEGMLPIIVYQNENEFKIAFTIEDGEKTSGDICRIFAENGIYPDEIKPAERKSLEDIFVELVSPVYAEEESEAEEGEGFDETEDEEEGALSIRFADIIGAGEAEYSDSPARSDNPEFPENTEQSDSPEFTSEPADAEEEKDGDIE